MIRRWALALAVAAGAWALTGTAGADDRAAFRVCADANYLPWSNEAQAGFENRIASLLAGQLGLPVAYTWFPQRLGFIRNTLRAQDPGGSYRCDVVMGVPHGYELTDTTDPYYHSTYAVVFVEGRGLDSIRSASDLATLGLDLRRTVRFGLAERNPGTLWLAKYDMLDRLTRAYPSQYGDPGLRPTQLEQEDLLAGKIDLTFLWGPIAGHFAQSHPDVPIRVIPLESEPGLRFHFGISVGVRYGNRDWKEQLQNLLDDHAVAVEAILRDHGVPLVDAGGRLLEAR